MSTLRVSNINHGSATSGGLNIDSSGVVTGALPYPNRNLLYNGAMQVHQRGTSVTGLNGTGYFTADRWRYTRSNFGTWTQTVENDAPVGSGLRKSFKMLCTTANNSLISTAYGLIEQRLEGQDLQRIAKGTASAQQLTLSFWVKSNVTGTYVVSLYDEDNNRSVSLPYTVSASATWERKALTFPADTVGVLDNDANSSFTVNFILGAGSGLTSSALQTSWGTYENATWAQGQTNLAAATDNYWQITGVQLETGDTSTEFEFKSYGQELRECQRYYFRYDTGGEAANGRIPAAANMGSSTSGWAIIYFPQKMRARPSSLDFSQVRVTDNATADSANSTISLQPERSTSAAFVVISTSGSPTGANMSVFVTSVGYLGFSAEL